MEKIDIQNRKNKRLSALFHEPTSQTNKIVIITHSFKGDKDYQPIMREFSERICNDGYAVIRFDCWGSGESDGEFENSSITTQIEDLEDVIKYSRSIGYSEICLIGLSLGTTDSIMAYDSSIKCMVLWSPVFEHGHLYEDYKDEILKNGFIMRERLLTGEKVKCGKAMWQEFKDVRPYERLSEIKCPVLAIIGSEDSHISEDKAKRFMAMIPAEIKLEVIQGGDHDFLVEEAKEKAIQFSANFIRHNL